MGGVSELMIPRRFRGPSSSGNGGWSAGALAAFLVDGDGPWPPVEVTLRRPPPLETPLPVRASGERAVLLTAEAAASAGAGAVPGAEEAVAEAVLRPADTPLTVVEPVDPATAREAREGYAGLRTHPFPECFACGPDRAEGDGLRIFPGPVHDGEQRSAASTWTPSPAGPGEPASADEHATLPVTWAALDCIGAWTSDINERAIVLGRMTARVEALPRVGEEHVVVGSLLRTEGRRTFTAGTLYDADGRVVATAEHVWFEVDPATFQ